MATKFIAEVSSNHNNNLQRAKDFIKAAAEIGCNGIKFQLFKIDQLFAPEVLQNSPQHRKRKEWELPVEFIPELAEYTHQNGLLFSCTPFYLDAVTELEPYVDFYKIASYELLWSDLLKKCAITGKPIVLSTGMATLDEINSAIQNIKDLNSKDITILHCTSSYPTQAAEANLNVMQTFQQQFNNKFPSLDLEYGYSDHTVSPGVIYKAVLGHKAAMIEFHLDLDSHGNEFGFGHCWLPEKIQKVIHNCREAETADGKGEKTPAASELAEREWRADPEDGLRPLKTTRKKLYG